MVARDNIGAMTSIGLVQKCGGNGTVLPFHCTTRVRISVIFISRVNWWHHGSSAQDFALGHIARNIEQLNLVDGFEVRVIGELPDNLFVGRKLKDLRLLPKMAMTQPVAENRVAIRQPLKTGHEP